MMTVAADPIVQQAEEAAAAASRSANVSIRDLQSLPDLREVQGLFDSIWGDAKMDAGVLRALTYAGNFAAAAYRGDPMIGALTGFLGMAGGETILHSHILGVDEAAQARGVGFALKQHQRAWSLRRRIARIEWTFDPLIARNAHFNFTKLGAGCAAYEVDFYGRTTDAINAGDATDRLVVDWRLASAHAIDASTGSVKEHSLQDLLNRGASIALDVDPDGSPQMHKTVGDVILCALPADIVALRQTDIEKARAWRRALRDSLMDAFERGYRVIGFVKSGWYVLEEVQGEADRS